MGICQILLFQIRFNIYSALNEKNLVFRLNLICPHEIQFNLIQIQMHLFWSFLTSMYKYRYICQGDSHKGHLWSIAWAGRAEHLFFSRLVQQVKTTQFLQFYDPSPIFYYCFGTNCLTEWLVPYQFLLGLAKA